VEQWLERFDVSHLQDRNARQISGGEAQRVSLARAFALQPDILLLDEPFSALDAPTRTRLLSNLQSLLAETGQTVVYITHDMDEAMSLADRLAVMLQGAIKQVGPPDQVFAAPVDHEVASFVGMETTVAGRIIESDDGQTVVKVGSQNLEAVGNYKKDQQVLFCIRPEDVTLWTGEQLPKSSARNHVSGKISFLRPHGHLVHVTVDCGFPVGALITRASAREMELSEGSQVSATFKASAVHLIPRE
jgi:molybdopterin-binding protein